MLKNKHSHFGKNFRILAKIFKILLHVNNKIIHFLIRKIIIPNEKIEKTKKNKLKNI